MDKEQIQDNMGWLQSVISPVLVPNNINAFMFSVFALVAGRLSPPGAGGVLPARGRAQPRCSHVVLDPTSPRGISFLRSLPLHN